MANAFCLCLTVSACVRLYVCVCVCLSEHQSNASFPDDFISRLCEVCQKCVVSCPTIFWPAHILYIEIGWLFTGQALTG